MQEVQRFLGTEAFLITITIVIVILFVGFIIILLSNIKIKNNYNKFLEKLGCDSNIKDDLENYIYRVERVEKQNNQILSFCKELDDNMYKCIQKIGIVRYSAFKDTGSDLSFALALLDQKNNGVVLNGIYSRDISNIYAKPVKEGKSTYTLSEEELQSIERAINFKS